MTEIDKLRLAYFYAINSYTEACVNGDGPDLTSFLMQMKMFVDEGRELTPVDWDEINRPFED